MIFPEIKRVVRFEEFSGKTIKEVVVSGFRLRFVFTDGTFADLDTEATADAKIVLQGRTPRRRTPYH